MPLINSKWTSGIRPEDLAFWPGKSLEVPRYPLGLGRHLSLEDMEKYAKLVRVQNYYSLKKGKFWQSFTDSLLILKTLHLIKWYCPAPLF